MAAKQSAPHGFEIGTRIRNLRKDREMSMRALARQSGISPNALSMIERGLTSPSVSTVYKISHAMHLPVTAIFRDQLEKKNVVARCSGKSPQVDLPHGSFEELGGEEFEGSLEAFLVTLEPGAHSGELPIIHTGNDFAYVLQGQVEYAIEDKCYAMQTADSLLFTGNLPHRFSNPGDDPARLLIIIGGFTEGEVPGDHILHSLNPNHSDP